MGTFEDGADGEAVIPPALGFPGGPEQPPYGTNMPGAPAPGTPPPPHVAPAVEPPAGRGGKLKLLAAAGLVIAVLAASSLWWFTRSDSTPPKGGPSKVTSTTVETPSTTQPGGGGDLVNCETAVQQKDDPFELVKDPEAQGVTPKGDGAVGELQWAARIPTDMLEANTLAQKDGLVILSSDPATAGGLSPLVAKSTADGSTVWSVELNPGDPTNLVDRGAKHLGDNQLFFGARTPAGPRVVGVDLQTGKVSSCYQLPDPGRVFGSIQIVGEDQVMYVDSIPNSNGQSWVAALSGEGPRFNVKGTYDTALGSDGKTIIVGGHFGDTLYHMADAAIHGLSSEDGTVLWVKTVAELSSKVTSVDGSPVTQLPTDKDVAVGGLINAEITGRPGVQRPGSVTFAYDPNPSGAAYTGSAIGGFALSVAYDGSLVWGAGIWVGLAPLAAAGDNSVWLAPSMSQSFGADPDRLWGLFDKTGKYTPVKDVPGYAIATRAGLVSTAWDDSRGDVVSVTDLNGDRAGSLPAMMLGGSSELNAGALSESLLIIKVKASSAGEDANRFVAAWSMGSGGGTGPGPSPSPSPGPGPGSAGNSEG